MTKKSMLMGTTTAGSDRQHLDKALRAPFLAMSTGIKQDGLSSDLSDRIANGKCSVVLYIV